jgi:DNA-binding CsgD family transcriptional regulator/pimeloyl-ACP methyl ester carboxylesterase
MPPEIRYARTTDGVSIAYYAAGNGPALVYVPSPPYGNVEMVWRIAEYREQVEAAQQILTFIQYDPRGFGMSDRNVTDFSLDAMVLDMEAVADALQLERFCINVWTEVSMPALVYAARHPDRVIGLALREGVAQGSRVTFFDAQLQLARDNWELCKLTIADTASNVRTVTGLAQLHKLIEHTATQDAFVHYLEQARTWDARDVLSSVTMPVLVTNDGYVDKDAGRDLAAALPHGLFAANIHARGERSPAEDAIRDFLVRAFASESERVSDPGAPMDSTARAKGLADAASLTPREVEILRLVVAGKSGREIAVELVLSPRTVERHIANIYRKTHTHGRAQLAAFAVRHNVG